MVADLLNVDQALEQILARITMLSYETVMLNQARRRILAQDVYAALNLPPFPNSSMDGYAVCAEDIHSASSDNPTTLSVTMDIPAGTAPTQTLKSGEAARIMTGAPIPDGANAIVPVEDTDDGWTKDQPASLPETVKIFRHVQSGSYIRPIGESVRQGQKVLESGTQIRAQEIGMLASLGQSKIPVVRKPCVAIISTGDELVDITAPLKPGQIRDSNSYMLTALVEAIEGIPMRLPPAGDSPDAVRELFQTAITREPDVIISSAGVSVGTADHIRDILEELGEIGFWQINLRPGKPLAFGQIQNVPFFGLPGNPVSAMVTFDVLVRPALLKLGGRQDTASYRQAIVGEDLNSDGRRSYLRVTLSQDGDRLIARTTGTQSSGALMSMVLADGLLIIPEGTSHVEQGTELTVRMLKEVDGFTS